MVYARPPSRWATTRRFLAAALVLVASAVLAGCGGETSPQTDLAPYLKSATSAEAWRIHGDSTKPSLEFFTYKDLSGPVTLDESLRKELIGLLVDPKVIGDGLHPCVPTPGIKVKFTRPGAAPVWVFFCFECNEVFVYEDKQHREHKGFDHGAKPLAAVMKKIFPQDPVIQRLK